MKPVYDNFVSLQTVNVCIFLPFLYSFILGLPALSPLLISGFCFLDLREKENGKHDSVPFLGILSDRLQ